MRGHLPLHELLVPALLGRLAQGQRGTDEEHACHHRVEDLVRKEVEQSDADRDGDDDVHGEGGSRAEPDDGRPTRVDMTKDANIVLSGSSPRKMIGKTAKTTANCTGTFLSIPNVTVRRLQRRRAGALSDLTTRLVEKGLPVMVKIVSSSHWRQRSNNSSETGSHP